MKKCVWGGGGQQCAAGQQSAAGTLSSPILKNWFSPLWDDLSWVIRGEKYTFYSSVEKVGGGITPQEYFMWGGGGAQTPLGGNPVYMYIYACMYVLIHCFIIQIFNYTCIFNFILGCCRRRFPKTLQQQGTWSTEVDVAHHKAQNGTICHCWRWRSHFLQSRYCFTFIVVSGFTILCHWSSIS